MWPAKETGDESLAQSIKRVGKPLAKDSGFDKVYIGPQAMRTFKIAFNINSKAFFQGGVHKQLNHNIVNRITLQKINVPP